MSSQAIMTEYILSKQLDGEGEKAEIVRKTLGRLHYLLDGVLMRIMDGQTLDTIDPVSLHPLDLRYGAESIRSFKKFLCKLKDRVYREFAESFLHRYGLGGHPILEYLRNYYHVYKRDKANKKGKKKRETLYCLCKQPDSGRAMVQCSFGKKCVGGEWFHYGGRSPCVTYRKEKIWMCPPCVKAKARGNIKNSKD